MGDLSVRGKLGAEAICREVFVAVVVLDDLPHGLEGHGVRVHLVRTHVVQRGGLGRVPWGGKRHSSDVYSS